MGGIFSPEDALAYLHAGANLVQVYTGWVYRGPSLIKRINAFIDDQVQLSGKTSLDDYLSQLPDGAQEKLSPGRK